MSWKSARSEISLSFSVDFHFSLCFRWYFATENILKHGVFGVSFFFFAYRHNSHHWLRHSISVLLNFRFWRALLRCLTFHSMLGKISSFVHASKVSLNVSCNFTFLAEFFHFFFSFRSVVAFVVVILWCFIRSDKSNIIQTVFIFVSLCAIHPIAFWIRSKIRWKLKKYRIGKWRCQFYAQTSSWCEWWQRFLKFVECKRTKRREENCCKVFFYSFETHQYAIRATAIAYAWW